MHSPVPPFGLVSVSGAASAPAGQVNPFQVNQPQPPTLNQMRVSPMMGLSGQGFSMAQRSNEPLPLSSMPPAGLVSMGPMAGMAPLGSVGQMSNMGIPASMSMPQPLMSGGLPPTGTATQGGGTTNPFLLWGTSFASTKPTLIFLSSPFLWHRQRNQLCSPKPVCYFETFGSSSGVYRFYTGRRFPSSPVRDWYHMTIWYSFLNFLKNDHQRYSV